MPTGYATVYQNSILYNGMIFIYPHSRKKNRKKKDEMKKKRTNAFMLMHSYGKTP